MTLEIQLTLQFTNKLERQLENVNGGVHLGFLIEDNCDLAVT